MRFCVLATKCFSFFAPDLQRSFFCVLCASVAFGCFDVWIADDFPIFVNQIVAISSVTIEVNFAPSEGECFVTMVGSDDDSYSLWSCLSDPSECRVVTGTALKHSYQVYCASYIDSSDDYPLEFEFILFDGIGMSYNYVGHYMLLIF